MAIFIKLFFLICMVVTMLVMISAQQQSKTLPFNIGFNKLYGDQNIVVLDQAENSVQISLDKSTGSGFISRKPYFYAKFSAAIKLPRGYTAGVVPTFYASNNQVYQNNHDELDLEFLGNVNTKGWIVQTNVYGDGSTNRGKEEGYRLWFDPSQDFHTYTILWTENWTVFYIDDIPIRSVRAAQLMGREYPSKPMSLYGTIWDGSDWATEGGKRKIIYNYAPFNVVYSNFIIDDKLSKKIDGLTLEEKIKMKSFRSKYIMYSYCNDRKRYPNSPPECPRRGK